jgi:hypothetical protein
LDDNRCDYLYPWVIFFLFWVVVWGCYYYIVVNYYYQGIWGVDWVEVLKQLLNELYIFICKMGLVLGSVDHILFICLIPMVSGIFLLFIPNKKFTLIRAFVISSAVSTCFMSQYLLVSTSRIVGSLIPNIYP